jgi:hypothetical protein
VGDLDRDLGRGLDRRGSEVEEGGRRTHLLVQQLADLFAAAQHGYVTRAQATQVGADDVDLHRLVRAHYLERTGCHGVYRFRGAGDLPGAWAPLWAAWLSLDPARHAVDRADQPTGTEVARGRTAAFVHELGDLPPEPYQLWTPRRRRVRRPELRLHVSRLPATDVTVVRGLPVTTPLRTVADLVVDHEDLGHVAGVLRDAARQHLVLRDPEGLAGRLASTLGRTLPASRRRAAGAAGAAGSIAEELVDLAGIGQTEDSSIHIGQVGG